MRLVDEHPRLDTRVVVHELARLVEIGVEDADAADLALVGNRTDDREQPVGPQREIAPPVLPDDLVGAVAPVVGASLQDHQAVRLGPGEHLAHELVGDLGHAVPPSAVLLCTPASHTDQAHRSSTWDGPRAGPRAVESATVAPPRGGPLATAAATARRGSAAWSGRPPPAARRAARPGRPAAATGRCTPRSSA